MIKKVLEYVGRNFSYGVDIYRSLENEKKTRFPSLTRRTRTMEDIELSSGKKFVWEERMTE